MNISVLLLTTLHFNYLSPDSILKQIPDIMIVHPGILQDTALKYQANLSAALNKLQEYYYPIILKMSDSGNS